MSSSLSWLGSDNSFSIVGYSLGGPISLAFAGAFPESVRSLVLFGPAGLLHRLPEGYDNPVLLHPELAPSAEAICEAVRQILGVKPSEPPLTVTLDQKGSIPLKGGPSRVEQNFDMTAIYQWQFDYHKGHVHSFQDTVRYGPLQHREDLWSKVCNILAGRTRPDSPLHGSKLLAFFGGMIISWLLPPDHLQVEYLPGGHGFPYPNSEKITQTILSFWNSKSSPVLRKNSSSLYSPWECDSIGFCLLGNDRRPEDFIDVQLRIILINRCKCGVGGNTTSTLYILAFHQLQKC